MKVRPLRDRVLVQTTEPSKQTATGLIIPDNALEKPESGTVLAVGAGKIIDGTLIPMTVQVGDLVVFIKGIGEKVRIDGQDYIVMREDDIIGIIEL